MRERLAEKFKDKEFRQIYCEDFLNASIATQIRVLREGRNWSQKQLAEMVGTTQPAISAHESPDKTSWSLATLRKLASAFDLAPVVRFESFGKELEDIASFSRASLKRPSFKDDPAFMESQGDAPQSSVVVSMTDFVASRAETMSLKRGSASQSATVSVAPELEEEYG